MQASKPLAPVPHFEMVSNRSPGSRPPGLPPGQGPQGPASAAPAKGLPLKVRAATVILPNRAASHTPPHVAGRPPQPPPHAGDPPPHLLDWSSGLFFEAMALCKRWMGANDVVEVWEDAAPHPLSPFPPLAARFHSVHVCVR
jgi:hypothetical protein